MENCNSFFDDLGGPMMKKASTKILSVEQLAEIMGIDINDPRQRNLLRIALRNLSKRRE
jgi:hypothetical protein